MSYQPLSSPAEQRQVRTLAQEVLMEQGRGTELEKRLAAIILRALAQIDALTLMADPTTLRFQQGNHRYPALQQAGLGHLWVGPSFNDFAPGLVEACRKHLKTHNLPAQRGHALDYIRNRIREENWGALEQRWFEGLPRAVAGPLPNPSPKTGRGVPLAQAEAEQAPPFGTPEYWAWQERRQGGGV